MKDPKMYQFYHRKNLPHIQPEGSIFFITYRLYLTMPASYFEMIQLEKKNLDQGLKHITNQTERNQIFNKKLFAIDDSFIDKYQTKDNLLLQERCAQIIADELHANNKVMYDMHAYTIMPNHVHFLIKPLFSNLEVLYSLSEIMHKLKGRSARFINLEMNRTGQLWQNEYYDHYVRNETELHNIVHYIAMNPVKAGLAENPRDWQWTWMLEEYISLFENK